MDKCYKCGYCEDQDFLSHDEDNKRHICRWCLDDDIHWMNDLEGFHPLVIDGGKES